MRRKWFGRRVKSSRGETAGERAGRLFDAGHNCARSVFQSTSTCMDPHLLEVCDAFGGGIGDTKCLCGAVSGGVMSLGVSGRKRQAARLVEGFKQRNKTTCCKGLSAPYVWRSGDHLANCRRLTVEAANLVADLLGKR